MKYFPLSIIFFIVAIGWSQTNNPPTIIAEGDQAYCPLSQIHVVTNFSITDSDDTTIEAFHIQISTDYAIGQDFLSLSGNHPTIVASWNTVEGKLSLSGVNGSYVQLSDMIAAVQDVVFESTDPFIATGRTFSFTIGDANYLPTTGHFYEYVSYLSIDWQSAKDLAETYTYYGLQGYLATITTQEEAVLTGEQAAGAGWIGGSDEETEGVWKWMTGPEAGTVFWNGGSNGTTPNYANWNTGEPNSLGNEDYAHVTAPGEGIDGSWNDLPLFGDPDPDITNPYHPKGFMVEYGGTPGDPVLDIAASTTIFIYSINSTVDAERCGEGSVTLQATANDGTVLWFQNPSGGAPIATGTTFDTPILTSSTPYYVLASKDGCTEGSRVEVLAIIKERPILDAIYTLQNCDEDGVSDGYTDFNLSELDATILGSSNYTLSYHLTEADAHNNVDALSPFPFNNATANQVYVRVDNNECYEVATVQLQVSTTFIPDDFMQILSVCETTGFSSFNFDAISQSYLDLFPANQNLEVHYYETYDDALLEQNEITNTSNYENTIAFSQVLYVRVESEDNADCYGLGPHLTLNVNLIPEFEIDQSDIFCLDGEPIELSIYNPQGNYTYEWTNNFGDIVGSQQSIEVADAGQYTVVATSVEGCQSLPETFNVVASGVASITPNDITVVEFSNNNSITIDTTNLGLGDYEFALNDEYGLYQDSVYFGNVPSGEHTIFVRDKNGCGTVSITVFVSGFPKFFTPNGDTFNDTWNLRGWSTDYSNASNIKIFDRYGKLIPQVGPLSYGWDGTFNGVALPSTDFWYIATLVKIDGTITNYSGHFSLVR